MTININTPVIIHKYWTEFKALVISSKALSIQYEIVTGTDFENYTIFALDSSIAYTCNIWLNTIPPEVLIEYSQIQNDIDKDDFINNFAATANGRLIPGLVQTQILENTTVTSGGSQIFSGLGNRQVNLFVNITQAATGTGPGIQFTLQEIDPGDLTTAIGTTVTGSAIFAFPATQVISLNLTTSSALKVSWIIVGSSSPTFPGTYATLTSKPTTVFSGVDANGVERVFQPDSSGRLLVSGSNAISTPVTVDPVIVGGVNPGGVAGYSTLTSDNSQIISQGVNKQPMFINGTITSGSISNVSGLGVSMVNLFINIKNAPTGTNPGIIFSMYEIDPGDQATPIGTSVTGATLTGIGTQMLSLPLTTSGLVQVSWAVIGTSPSFTGVYVTALMKDANTVTGPKPIGSKMEGNPIINGAVDQAGNVQAISSKLFNGVYNLMVCDDKMVNKLDEIILLLTDIRDRKILGE
jgi:hypothetical protein